MLSLLYAALSIMPRNDMLPPTVYLVDFQGFQHGFEDFIIKELCIIDVSKPARPLHTLYLPPRCWNQLSRQQKRTYYYQTRRLHQIGWDEGYVRFCKECLQRDMERWLFTKNNSSMSVFYVMGQQKAAILQRLLPDYKIVNYQEAFNVKSCNDMPKAPSYARCAHREHGDYCAVKRCFSMYIHFTSL